MAPREDSTADFPLRQRSLTAGDVQCYRLAEVLSEALIFFLVIFGPWAFGTTQTWSIRTANLAGLGLGLLLVVKLAIRGFKGYRPPRWDDPESTPPSPGPRWITIGLALLTVALVAYCLVSVINARAVFHPDQGNFKYFESVRWLPNSLDAARSTEALFTCLALAAAFWAIRDWLLGRTAGEHLGRQGPRHGITKGAPLFPARLRRLLWLLAINGGLLGLEGIAQRLEGSGQLLFLVKPRVNANAVTQFGPWAYRANASQYFNLLWPVCLGFWWTLHRAYGFHQKRHHLLLLCGIVMAACPVISTSRGGALITAGLVVIAACFFLTAHFTWAAGSRTNVVVRRLTLGLVLMFFLAALAIGVGLGWAKLEPRFEEIPQGFAAREQIFESARPMAGDYPIFGTGPGTFETVFQLYRGSTNTYWPAQLHNDWLETRITFGWVGSLLIGLAFLLVLARWFVPAGIHGGRRFTVLTWLALTGVLVHARYDFPFQIHSVLALFVVLCAILSCLSRRP